jgi:hypothetical protein
MRKCHGTPIPVDLKLPDLGNAGFSREEQVRRGPTCPKGPLIAWYVYHLLSMVRFCHIMRDCLKFGSTAFAAARSRIRERSIATVPAVATVKIVRWWQYCCSSLARHWEILPASRAIPVTAALVTTALRLPVTMAPADQIRCVLSCFISRYGLSAL